MNQSLLFAGTVGGEVVVLNSSTGAQGQAGWWLPKHAVLLVRAAMCAWGCADKRPLRAAAGRVTGRVALQASALGGVGAACLEVSPTQLLVADSRGGLHLYSCLLQGGQLQPPQLQATAAGQRKSSEPACLELLPHSALARGPAALLADCQGRLLLYRLHEHKVRSGTEYVLGSCCLLAGRDL